MSEREGGRGGRGRESGLCRPQQIDRGRRVERTRSTNTHRHTHKKTKEGKSEQSEAMKVSINRTSPTRRWQDGGVEMESDGARDNLFD